MQIEIRRMQKEDLDVVMELEHLCFSMPWSRLSFEGELQNPVARYLACCVDGRLIGYAGVWLVLDEGHITNVCVHPDMRGRGFGEHLTRCLMQLCANLGITLATLEVRKSNYRAIALYEKLGFQPVGLRKGYYEDNREDAVLMACDTLPQPNEMFSDDEAFVNE